MMEKLIKKHSWIDKTNINQVRELIMDVIDFQGARIEALTKKITELESVDRKLILNRVRHMEEVLSIVLSEIILDDVEYEDCNLSADTIKRIKEVLYESSIDEK